MSLQDRVDEATRSRNAKVIGILNGILNDLEDISGSKYRVALRNDDVREQLVEIGTEVLKLLARR